MAQPEVPLMRFLCYGAGAIGSYIGGSLALAGHTVIFLDRPEMAAQLRQTGITLIKDGQRRQIAQPNLVESVEEALTTGAFDAAILAVKSFDTPGLLEMLAPYRMALPPVMCFQNGVENEALVREVLGEEKAIAGTVTTAIGRPGPGEIAVERLRGIGLANEHILANSLVAVLDGAGLRARLYANPGAMKWSKMLTNLIANASSAILNMTPGEIFADKRLFNLELAMMREALAVMRALGLPVVDLPGTPVRALAVAVAGLPGWLSRPLMRPSLVKGRGGKMPSFHIDLHGKRGKSEVEYLNGAVVRFGKRAGVETPVNQVLTDTLMGMTRGEIALERFDHRPEALLSLLG